MAIDIFETTLELQYLQRIAVVECVELNPLDSGRNGDCFQFDTILKGISFNHSQLPFLNIQFLQRSSFLKGTAANNLNSSRNENLFQFKAFGKSIIANFF